MKITKGTIIRTVLLFSVILNGILKKAGINIIPLDQNGITTVIEALIEIFAVISAWWYNNSFSKKARCADQFFKELKGE